MSLDWVAGSVGVCVLQIDRWHPWLEGLLEAADRPPGYFQTDTHRRSGDVGEVHWIPYTISSPNPLKVLGDESQSSVSRKRRPHPSRRTSYSSIEGDALPQCRWRTFPPIGPRESELDSLSLLLDPSSFPCALTLCDSRGMTSQAISLSKQQEIACRNAAAMLFHL